MDTYQRSIDSSNWYLLSRFNRFKDSDLLSVINLKSDSKKAISIHDKSHFVVLSIELEDTEQRLASFNALRNKLKEIGVTKPCCYLINEFDHIHIYLCFNEMFDSKTFHPMLKSWLRKVGLADMVNVLTTGMPIELPLQKDFAWINETLSVVVGRKDIATQPAIAMFLSDLNKGMLDLELFTLSIHPLDETRLEEDSYLIDESSKLLDFSPDDADNEEQSYESFEPLDQDYLAMQESDCGSKNVVQFKKRTISQPEAQVVNTESNRDISIDSESLELDCSDSIDSKKQEVPQEDINQSINTIECQKETASTMLPPPGSTSFKQLSIPFSTSVAIPPNLSGNTPS